MTENNPNLEKKKEIMDIPSTIPERDFGGTIVPDADDDEYGI